VISLEKNERWVLAWKGAEKTVSLRGSISEKSQEGELYRWWFLRRGRAKKNFLVEIGYKRSLDSD